MEQRICGDDPRISFRASDLSARELLTTLCERSGFCWQLWYADDEGSRWGGLMIGSCATLLEEPCEPTHEPGDVDWGDY